MGDIDLFNVSSGMFKSGAVLVRRTGCFRKRVAVSEENIPDAVTPERESFYIKSKIVCIIKGDKN